MVIAADMVHERVVGDRMLFLHSEEIFEYVAENVSRT